LGLLEELIEFVEFFLLAWEEVLRDEGEGWWVLDVDFFETLEDFFWVFDDFFAELAVEDDLSFLAGGSCSPNALS
jgi:hypothetical protein